MHPFFIIFRELGRGSAVHCRSSLSASTSAATGTTYVDNAYNRILGRVGLPFGSQVKIRLPAVTRRPVWIIRTIDGWGWSGNLSEALLYPKRPQVYLEMIGHQLVSANPNTTFTSPFRISTGKINTLERQWGSYFRTSKCEANPGQCHLVEKGIETMNRHEAAKAFSRSSLRHRPSG